MSTSGKKISASPKAMGFLVALGATALCVLLYVASYHGLEFPNIIEAKALDLRFRVLGVRPASKDVVVLAIDDGSIDALGRWPWPRSYMAEAMGILSDEGAKLVGFDVIFSEAEQGAELNRLIQLKQYYEYLGLAKAPGKAREFSQTLEKATHMANNDALFTEQVKRGGNAIFPIVFQMLDVSGAKPKALDSELSMPDRLAAAAIKSQEGATHSVPHAGSILLPLAGLMDNSRSLGHVNFNQDVDGEIRWDNIVISYGGREFIPISAVLVREFLGLKPEDVRFMPGKGLYIGDRLVPVDERGRMLVNFYGPHNVADPKDRRFQYISFASLLDGNYEPGTFKDKIVLVGSMATGLGDVWTTPFDKNMPGVEKHATIISNILQGDYIYRERYMEAIDLLCIVGLGLMLGYALTMLSPIRGAAFAAVVFVALYGANQAAFSHLHVWINLVFPALTVVMVSGSVIIYGFYTEEKKKREIKASFKYYLAPQIVDELAANPEKLKLGGQMQELTVLFSDIRGFTGISEKMTPETLVAMMNHYLTMMASVIMERSGTVDKFIGDAVMAFFGAPVHNEDHASRACDAALGMIAKLKETQKEWVEDLKFPPIRIGIGLNTGDMVVGNLGSQERFNYTVMGDSVNLGSRLEGLTKVYGVSIVISEYTAAKVKGYILRELDFVKVKGKHQPVRIYELMGKGEPSEALARELSEFGAALELYRNMKWAEGRATFHALGQKYEGKALYALYADRCGRFMAEPPEEPWDRVFEMRRK